MYPQDNIFNIYYNIGRRVPFQVKRASLRYGYDKDFLYSAKGRTFMVERVEPRGKYGKAYGYCMIDGVRNNDYVEQCYPDIKDGEIPCAGCGEWTLIDVPGIDMNELFPVHTKDEVLPFGKHKGETIGEVYEKDPKYVFWLADSDPYYRIDFAALAGIDPKAADAKEKFKKELDRVYPKTKVEDKITFGKYKGQTYKEVYEKDSQYINWFLSNNRNIDIDFESFRNMMNQ